MAKPIQVQMWQANNGKECRLELEALIEDFNAASVDPEELTVRGTLKPTHEFTEADSSPLALSVGGTPAVTVRAVQVCNDTTLLRTTMPLLTCLV